MQVALHLLSRLTEREGEGNQRTSQTLPSAHSVHRAALDTGSTWNGFGVDGSHKYTPDKWTPAPFLGQLGVQQLVRSRRHCWSKGQSVVPRGVFPALHEVGATSVTVCFQQGSLSSCQKRKVFLMRTLDLPKSYRKTPRNSVGQRTLLRHANAGLVGKTSESPADTSSQAQCGSTSKRPKSN